MAIVLVAPTHQASVTYDAACISLLEKCSGMKEIKQVHAKMIKTSLALETNRAHKLLAALCQTSDMRCFNYAQQVLERLGNTNTLMWNIIIRAYSGSERPEEALQIYYQMLEKVVPYDTYTFPFLLKACARIPATGEEIKQIHGHIIKNGFLSEAHTANSLLRVYTKSGDNSAARRLFDGISCRDIVSWNSMIDGYAKGGQIAMARQLFNLMEIKNLISWTSMIKGYVDHGLFKESLELFGNMQVMKIEPDSVTLASVLSACAQLGALDQGKWIHSYIKKKGIEVDQVLRCVLVDMYAKCGEIDEAVDVFSTEKERSVHVWTAMINAFAIHGLAVEALHLYRQMEYSGIKPNSITFTSLLTACSYAGLVEKGRFIFNRMERDYNIHPSVEHYGCMVDLLGRAGLLKEAENLIQMMPMKPNSAIWGALLNACCVHKNFELGKRVGRILIELEPDHGGRYIQLASILAAEGEWDEAVRVRGLMRGRQVAKLPGCSSISLDGIVHEFVAGDQKHIQIERISNQWNDILERLRKEGYVPATKQLLLDLEEDEKETAIHCHSEKLAIAFGLISTKPGTTVHIIKNLRVCADCHTVTKLISKVYGRKIIMRDRSRFHCFTDGNCTCRDNW